MKPELRLNDVEVKTSYLTQRSYQAAYCDLVLKVTPENQEQAIAEFQRTGALGLYSGLSISGIEDLSFLAQFPLLLYLEVFGQRPINTRYLDDLENLRGLDLETPGAGVDFARFPHLEVYMGGWHAGNRNLAASPEMRRLIIRAFNPKSGDLDVLAGMTRLESLEITQTNIESLRGLEMLEDLRYLSVSYAAKLEALDALASPGVGLRELALRNAKKIRSYQPISDVRKLRRLKITTCAPMENLAWTAGMQDLDFFSFVETDVLDGDLAPLLELPKLRYAGTLDRKHYNFTCDALNAMLASR